MDSFLSSSAYPLPSDPSGYRSPRLNDFDGSPQAPPPHDSFDYTSNDGPHFPHTPSYNGSYQNSPYSFTSELPTFDSAEDSLGLFVDNPSGISITQEYDPSEYDLPNGSGLLTIDDGYMTTIDSHNPHVSISVASYEHQSSTPFDYSSPSSNGGDDDKRSRASSVSEHMQSKSSPRLDFTQNFESFNINSPNWASNQLPSGSQSPPPAHKPPSPPQLVIPDTATSPSAVIDDPPIINAPDGDGGVMMDGPQLHIVPATPISGGGAQSQPVPFQQTLATLQQGQSPLCLSAVSVFA